MNDSSITRIFALHDPSIPVDLSLASGQKVYAMEAGDPASALCTNLGGSEDGLVIDLPALTNSSIGRLRPTSIQIDLDDDADFVICRHNEDIVSSVYHFVLIPTNLSDTVRGNLCACA